MTTTPPPAGGPPTAPPGTPVEVLRPENPIHQIRIYSHSPVYYWWPLWVIGYIMAFLTYADRHIAPIVPEGSLYQASSNSIILPPGSPAPGSNNPGLKFASPDSPKIGEHMSESKNLGIIFTVALLMIIFITNTPLRGLWSAVFLLLVIVATLVFAQLHWWDRIFHFFGRISIHMNLGFYVFFSTLLLALWLAVVFGFDRMHYWLFRPGQVTFEAVFGGGQRAYDPNGMVFEKRLSDLFRHYLLGLGSGDLIITFGGAATREPIQIPNVLFLTHAKIRRLEAMIAEKPIT
jgi:hypothetical protein